jgi:hypothetical protein
VKIVLFLILQLAAILPFNANPAFCRDFQEDEFLRSREMSATSISIIDQEELRSILSDQRFLTLEVTGRVMARKSEMYLATRGLLGYLSAATGLDGVPVVASYTTRFPRLTSYVPHMISAAILKTIGHFEKSDNLDDIVDQSKQVVSELVDTLEAFAISSPNQNVRLEFHQRSFLKYLASRDAIDRLYDQKISEINPSGLSISNFWNFGKDQEKYYALQVARLQSQLAVDNAEGDYLSGALLKLAAAEDPQSSENP